MAARLNAQLAESAHFQPYSECVHGFLPNFELISTNGVVSAYGAEFLPAQMHILPILILSGKNWSFVAEVNLNVCLVLHYTCISRDISYVLEFAYFPFDTGVRLKS